MFASVPWRELRDAYQRAFPGVRVSPGIAGLVNHWNAVIGGPKGFKVKRWRYDYEKDRIVLDIDWKPKKAKAT